jgi:hypothetical protein
MRARFWPILAAALVVFARSARAQDKYALGVFHFNIQYVAGGTIGLFPGGDSTLNLDNDAVEDQIVTQSFKPVLDLYKAHPSWGVDIEMQGYMLDVIAERHPDVLAELKELATSGQIEVVSFHYSDQLFTAFPEQDWERSQALTAATFKKYGVPLGKSVFCQEGQAGMGMAPQMAAHGYRTMIWPKNLWIYQHGNFNAAPLYQFGQGYLVVAGQDVNYTQGSTNIQVTWTYMDDGELMATNNVDPYFPSAFKLDPASVNAYEQKLSDLEAQGYQITTVDKYVNAVKAEVTPATPPPLMDGTWQPGSTDAELKWLGGNGIEPGERDNEVRTLNALAHRELTAAETAAQVAGLDASAELDSAWRMLFLAEVSDATGINPFRGEVQYGIAYSTEAMRIARDVIDQGKTKLGATSIVIDPSAGSAVAGSGGADPLRGTSLAQGPVAVQLDAGDRKTHVAWEQVTSSTERVAITFDPGNATDVHAVFPSPLSPDLVTTLALDDTTAYTFHKSDFSFSTFYMALPSGLVSLGPSSFLVEDQGFAHLAANVTLGANDVSFEDQTIWAGQGDTWVFYLFQGSAADAVKLADRVNVTRRLVR